MYARRGLILLSFLNRVILSELRYSIPFNLSPTPLSRRIILGTAFQCYHSRRPAHQMNQNELFPNPSGVPSLPTELLLEIFSQTLLPDYFETIVTQQTPRRRQRLYGPREAYLITECARRNLRQVSKLFKALVDAYPGLSSSKQWVHPSY